MLRTAPVPVSGGQRFAAISAGDSHTCGLTTGGAAWCWGLNQYGELGDGTTTMRLVPVPVSGGLGFASISAGGHTCGVTPGGQAYCWGWNQFGQLGDGTTDSRLTPVSVAGGLLFATVATGGGSHTCGVTPTGEAYCWGQNDYGVLGNGNTTDSHVPVAVYPGESRLSPG